MRFSPSMDEERDDLLVTAAAEGFFGACSDCWSWEAHGTVPPRVFFSAGTDTVPSSQTQHQPINSNGTYPGPPQPQSPPGSRAVQGLHW